ncbi:MAG: YqhA family protein [Chloroflexi bacterium]|nr:YqhA family protein [Chloroflexota bacterium]
MRKLIESSRYMALIGVVALLFAAFMAFVWGGLKTFKILQKIVVSYGQDPQIISGLVQLLDAFLIAAALYLFAVSLYELFIDKLNLPDWMLAHNLYELKTKLSSVIILVMGVNFLENVMAWRDAQATLQFGLAIAIVSAALIGLSYATQKGKD